MTFTPGPIATAVRMVPSGGTRSGRDAYLGYSPYCVPRVIDGVKCVIVNEALKSVEPMAWEFVMNFARDNRLQVTDACLLPKPGERAPQ